VFAWLLSRKREGTKKKINNQEWGFPYKLKSGGRVYNKTLTGDDAKMTDTRVMTSIKTKSPSTVFANISN
jgi:hypothetical protein